VRDRQRWSRMLEKISAWICGRHRHERKSLDASWRIRRARSTDPSWLRQLRRLGRYEHVPWRAGDRDQGVRSIIRRSGATARLMPPSMVTKILGSKVRVKDRGSDRTGRFLTPRLAHVFLGSDRRWYRRHRHD
jgi:hypothetical protein